jgi:hypothetical protein
LQLSSQYELWAEQLQNGELPRGKLKDAEVQLRNLSDHVNHIQASTYEVAQRGQDLLQVNWTTFIGFVPGFYFLLSEIRIELNLALIWRMDSAGFSYMQANLIQDSKIVI